MRKNFITIAVALLFSTIAMAENQRVAVFNPAGNAENHVNEIVREIFSSVIVNTEGYIVLERSLIDRVLAENLFQAEGLVDDAQISEMGRMMGANLAFVTSLTRMGDGNFFVSARLIDVQTARIEKQQTARTSRAGETELIITAERLAGEMFAQHITIVRDRVDTEPTFISNQPPLVLRGTRVYQEGVRLSSMQVQGLMAGTDAFRLYERGLSRNRTGNIFLGIGAGLTVAGLIPMLQGPNSWWDDYSYSDGQWLMMGIGVGGGIIMATTGWIMKSRAQGLVRNSVDMHNRSQNQPRAELNFGITPNGVGLVVNF